MRRPSWILAIIATIAVVALPGGAFATTNSVLPFVDTFETYTNLTPLNTGTNGWYASAGSVMVQTNIVRTGTNAAIIPAAGTLSNRFENIAVTNIWLQMDLRPGLFGGVNYPVKNTNQVWMFFVDSNGNFVVHDGPVAPATNWVTATNNVTMATNGTTWVRVNIYENFEQTNWTLYADGVLVTNNIGFLNPDLTNFSGFEIYNGATNCATTNYYLDNVSVAAMDTNQPPLIVNPPALAAVAFAGRTPPGQTSKVYNVWSSDIGFEITTNRPWVSAAPTRGVVTAGATQNVVLAYANSTTSWPAGAVSNATVTLVATNGTGDRWNTQTVSVVMSIMDLDVTPSNITDTVAAGATPASTNFDVINAGAGSFAWTATITNNWLGFPAATTSGTANASSTNTLTLVYSNTAGMTSGTNNTTIKIASSDGGGATQTVNVALIITTALQVDPVTLSNAVMQGETTTTNFQVWTDDPVVANYTVSNGQPWLVLSQAGGSLTGQTDWATNTIGITYTNTSELTVGDHTDTITISAPECTDVTIPVTLTVQAPPMLSASPTLITKTLMAGQNLTDQTLRIWNGNSDYEIWYHVTTNQGGASTNWLSVQVTNNYLDKLATNTLTAQYTVSALTSAGDAPSNYCGTITVTATNANGSPAKGSPVIIPVTVKVNPKPRLALSLTNLSQTVLQGQDALSQEFDLWNASGSYTLNYTISKGTTPWLVLIPSSGTSTGQPAHIEVQYSTASLPAGVTNALITVVGRAWDGLNYDSARDATQQITLALSVTPFATLATDAQPDYAYTVRKGLTPPTTVFSVQNGANLPNAMYFTVSSSASWLRMTPSSGTSTGNLVAVQATADPASMKPGVLYSSTVRIDATDAASGKPAYESPVTFTISVVIRDFIGFDFQGGFAGASDLVLYREANGVWEIKNLLSGYATTQFLGGVGYQAVPGDYTGDGITEIGIYRPASGSWYAWEIGSESVYVIEWQQWVGDEYAGVPGDYDGDGKTDPGVYQEQTGLWVILMSGSGYQPLSGTLGGAGYSALPAGDYDGDAKADPAVYHRASGLWMVLFSTSHSIVSGIFGGSGFVPVPTDYDGDGLADPAIYATETGYWSILPSTTLTSKGYSIWTRQFGGAAMSATLAPAPGNYDGSGSANLGLYDTAACRWYIITLDGTLVVWGYPMGSFGTLPVLP